MNSKIKLPLTWAYLAIVYCQTSFPIITRLLDFLNWLIVYSDTHIFQSSLLSTEYLQGIGIGSTTSMTAVCAMQLCRGTLCDLDPFHALIYCE